MKTNDSELIRLCKTGDRNAFNELVQAYQAKVINIAYGMLSDADDASDAAQEVFIKVYRSIGNFKEQSSFSTWIYRITANVCTDFLRKKSRHINTLSINAHMGDDEHEFDIKDDSHTPDEQLEISETQREVRNAIAVLKDEYKAVLTLCDIEGLAYDKTADILNVPIGTVKSRLSRARGALKKELLKNRNFFT